KVYFAGRPATGITLEAARVRLLTPANRAGVAPVVVTNPDGQSHTLAGGFNYYVPPPVIARIDPLFGPVEGGTIVTIHGRNLTAETQVTIGGKPINDRELAGSGTVRGRAPKGETFGYSDVQVITGALADTLKNGFYYTDKDHPFPGSVTGPRPIAVRRVVPSTGPSAGGITVNVIGDGFQEGAKVSFGGTAATEVKILGATSLTARLPPGQVGAATVEVENPDKGKDRLEAGFNYYNSQSTTPGPRISGVAPSTGPITGGTRAVILGANLVQGCKVYFGKSESTNVRFVSGSQLVVDTPAVTQAGSVTVTVVNPDGKSDSLFGGFAYYQRSSGQLDPVIAQINPATGPANAETDVVLTGQHFQQGALVFAGDAPVGRASVTSATELAATMPARASGKVD
ncbi:MAG: IPT/TIG domain-containing protein, partial [Myxococcales bacterium]